MTPPPAPTTTVTLRALEGEPLADEMVRRTVVAAAHAIAERNGVRLLRLDADPARVTATLETPRLAAIGFAAELRRVTTEWYRRRSGAPTLWGEPATDGDGPEDPYGLFGPPSA
jgi:hypothetical protein